MKRKRHGSRQDRCQKTKKHEKQHQAIDLTLSDEDETKEDGKKGNNIVVLSDDAVGDGDEVLFVKNGDAPSVHPVVHNKATPSTGKTINDVLKDKKLSSSTLARSLPPLLLSTPLSVSTHTPCSLHYDILPAKLAETLYKAMLRESATWTKNKWYLNDRLVESNHKTCFYHSEVDGRFDEQWYMGRKLNDTLDNGGNVQGRTYVEEMEEARLIIEEFVNEQLKGKKRYDLEYDGEWKANVAASNCYRGGAETVGYHADQLTYLGPYPTIASLSLGTTRVFRLRGVQSLQEPASAPPPRTYDIELPHNSLCIMGAGCQEKFKHTIPPARSIDVFKCKNGDRVETYIERINITFRFYRPDFLPANTPVCHCNVPCVLKADAKGKAAMNSARSCLQQPGENVDDSKMRFFWMCFAGAQNEGKKCNYFKLLDMKGEKRGPCIGGDQDRGGL